MIKYAKNIWLRHSLNFFSKIFCLFKYISRYDSFIFIYCTSIIFTLFDGRFSERQQIPKTLVIRANSLSPSYTYDTYPNRISKIELGLDYIRIAGYHMSIWVAEFYPVCKELVCIRPSNTLLPESYPTCGSEVRIWVFLVIGFDLFGSGRGWFDFWKTVSWIFFKWKNDTFEKKSVHVFILIHKICNW